MRAKSNSSSSCVCLGAAEQGLGTSADTTAKVWDKTKHEHPLCALAPGAAAALLCSQRREDLRCEAATSFLCPLFLSNYLLTRSSLLPLINKAACCACHSRQHVLDQMDMLTYLSQSHYAYLPRNHGLIFLERASERGSEEETCVYASASAFHSRMLT